MTHRIVQFLALISAVAAAYVVFATRMATEPAEQTFQAQETDDLKWLGTVRSAELNEISGVAISHHYSEAAWVHNDSGGEPIVYLISLQGQLLARCKLLKADNRDWEDVCCFHYGEKNYLLVGDVGDNGSKNRECNLYLFDEPIGELAPKGVSELPIQAWRAIRFSYEDGPRNCEAVGFDESSASVIAIEKKPWSSTDAKSSGVYVIDIRSWLGDGDRTEQPAAKAQRVAELAIPNVTGLAFSSTGKELVVRDYLSGYLFEREADQSWIECIGRTRPTTFALPIQKQGEAICFAADGKHVIVVSEFAKSPIWSVRLPVANDLREAGSRRE